jgi:hypothetical protein
MISERLFDFRRPVTCFYQYIRTTTMSGYAGNVGEKAGNALALAVTDPLSWVIPIALRLGAYYTVIATVSGAEHVKNVFQGHDCIW